MKKFFANRQKFSVAAVFALTIFSASLALAYTTSTSIYTPPDYTTFKPPVSGGSYTDAVFGTAIKRLSDAMQIKDADSGQPVIYTSQEYSTMTPFNMDNTRLLLEHTSYFSLYDGAGNVIKDLYAN